MKRFIDLNSDMGEGFGNWSMGSDEALLDLITSANVACGFHASDPNIMDKTVRMAKEKGVAVGCHFGLPDLEGFGRRKMEITNEQAYNYTLYQLGALNAFVKKHNMKMQHAKIHGALFSMAAEDEVLSKSILSAIQDFDKDLMFFTQSSTKTYAVAKDMGFKLVDEFYIDRGAHENGQLVFKYSWDDIGGSYEAAAMRVVRALEKNEVVANTGAIANIYPNSLCIHGDTPNCTKIAELVKEKLAEYNYELKPIGEWY